MRNVIKTLLFLMIMGALQFASCSAMAAVDVVYPSKNNSTINAANAFIVGNIGQDVSLEINSKPVEVYKKGAFVYYTPLNHGANNFVMKSFDSSGKASVLNYVINRPMPKPPVDVTKKNVSVLAVTDDSDANEFSDYLIAKVSKNYMPLRDGARDGASRVAHPNKGTYLNIDAQKGKYYRVYINDKTKFWIKEGMFQTLYRLDSPLLANLMGIKYSEDRNYRYVELNLDKMVPYRIKESPGGLDCTFYNIARRPEKTSNAVSIKSFDDHVLNFFVQNPKNFGYKVYEENGKVYLRLSKVPCSCDTKPLKGISIVIDPGHGGSEAGALGPTRVREADIALDISKRVEKLLRKEGANVLMTREENVNVGLYDRVDKIIEFNPSVSISIHANSLPDGVNPYVRYGSSVYYYYPQAKELAQCINNKLVKALQTRDDGVRFGNFVLTRITDPVAVLVETAYMINPYDFEKLTSTRYRQFAAQAIVDGLKEYFTVSTEEVR